MRKTTTQMIQVGREVTIEVQCDRCKKTEVGQNVNSSDIQEQVFKFGYGSEFDGETWVFHLCDTCIKEFRGSFLKNEVDIEEDE